MLTSPRKHSMSMCAFLLQTCTLKRRSMASTAHFSEEEMAELREAFSKVGECKRPWVWTLFAGSLLVSQLTVVKWASSSADLLCHKPQRVLPVLQSSQWNQSTPCSILQAEQQILWYSLETWTEILKNAAYSRGMIGKGIDFYLNAKWVPLLGRNGLVGTNVQMATKFVIPFLWPFKPRLLFNYVFPLRVSKVPSAFFPLKSCRFVTAYPNSKRPLRFSPLAYFYHQIHQPHWAVCWPVVLPASGSDAFISEHTAVQAGSLKHRGMGCALCTQSEGWNDALVPLPDVSRSKSRPFSWPKIDQMPSATYISLSSALFAACSKWWLAAAHQAGNWYSILWNHLNLCSGERVCRTRYSQIYKKRMQKKVTI